MGRGAPHPSLLRRNVCLRYAAPEKGDGIPLYREQAPSHEWWHRRWKRHASSLARILLDDNFPGVPVQFVHDVFASTSAMGAAFRAVEQTEHVLRGSMRFDGIT
jgi:hypothetical protein